MSTSGAAIVLINGREPSIEQLVHPALVNYGHFTAMQVRGGATRGLDLHLRRLLAAHSELFDSTLDTHLVLRYMRTAVEFHPDSYLRVTVYEESPGIPHVMTVIRPPLDPPHEPQSLLPVTYVRPFAHVKHLGSFAQIYYSEIAQRQGHDDAVLVGFDGRLSETTIANIGFFDGEQVVWPNGPSLHGITWQLLDRALESEGSPARRADVTEGRALRLDGAFTANSLGVSPVGRLGLHRLPTPQRAFAQLSRLYASLPWQPI